VISRDFGPPWLRAAVAGGVRLSDQTPRQRAAGTLGALRL